MYIRKIVCQLLLALLFTKTAFTQQTTTAHRAFLGFFEDNYRKSFTKPIDNYFQVLTKALGTSFNFDDNRCLNAVSAIVNQGLTEREAIDSLFSMAIQDMLGRYIWQPAEDVYNQAEKLMQYNNSFLCPCFNKQLKGKNTMEKLVEAFTACSGKLLTDSAYLRGYQQNSGSLTVKELYSIKGYFFIYIYQHCPQVLSITNETLLNTAVRDTYMQFLWDRKMLLGKDIARYLQKQRLDSLALVFPNYKKFGAAINKAIALLKDKAVATGFYYNMPSNNAIESIYIRFFKKDKRLGELKLTTPNRILKKTITAAAFVPTPKESDEIIEERIIEIKEGE
jgi:hypothetical protein